MAQLATPIRCDRGVPGRSHSLSFDQRRRPDTLRTAMTTAFFCPTNTTSRLPRVTPGVEEVPLQHGVVLRHDMVGDLGTYVPVEEPSTASGAEKRKLVGARHERHCFGRSAYYPALIIRIGVESDSSSAMRCLSASISSAAAVIRIAVSCQPASFR
jgi:hypothetical protein